MWPFDDAKKPAKPAFKPAANSPLKSSTSLPKPKSLIETVKGKNQRKSMDDKIAEMGG